jgi:phosphatidylinositol glycan class B
MTPLTTITTTTSTNFEKLLSSWWVGIGCCVFRMVNAWFVDSQFDPDEYWQTLEVAYCHVFGGTMKTTNCVATWEWTGDSPIRSYVSILPVWLLYKVLQLTGHDTSMFVAKGPSLLYALCFAGPTDWIVARLASSLSRSTPTVTISTTTTAAGLWALFCSITSWFHGYCLVRTYTNSIECFLITLITALLLMTNSKEFHNNYRKNRNALAFFLMGITVAGVRFTSLAAFLPLYLYTLISLLQQPTTDKLTLYHFLLFSSFYGLMGIFICIIIDRYFYGFWTIVSLNNFYINIVRNYSSLYGTHPFYWYFFVGIPVVSGTTLLIPILLVLLNNLHSPPTIITVLHTTTSSHHHMLFGVLILSYLLLHSLSAHKEFRFILPISPFICILIGNLLDLAHKQQQQQRGCQPTKDRGMKTWRSLTIVVLSFLITINFGIWYYLSRIHQRAPIQVNRLLLTQIARTAGINAKEVNSTVHYLMGCHSTPIYSHLHTHQPIQVRTLDCSPTCRILEQQQLQYKPVCESSLFLHHPLTFVESFYGIHSPSSCSSAMENPICSIATNQTHPNYIAIYEKEARVVHEILVQQMGMILVHRIPNGIRNIQLKFMQIPKINYDFMYLYQNCL